VPSLFSDQDSDYLADSKALQAKVELVDQSIQTLSLDRGQTAFGRLKFGIYQIRIDQLRKVEIDRFRKKRNRLG